ncbi:MAG: hypothetical protein NWF07_11980 [Candidatus Bathyarchaeota archaeon]|nr:hypothetical protein [Candidatus Bathyarchaeota archaeon]
MNTTQKTIALSAVLILTLSMTLGGIALVSAETDENVDATETPVQRHHRGHDLLSLLNDEQRAELDETIQTMRDMNATHQEIREYIEGFLTENGVEFEPPEAPARPEYTDEQLELFQQLREEVESYARQRAEELGLELPENGFMFGPRHHGPMRGIGSVESG